MNYTKLPFRQSDQKVFVASVKKAYNDFGWEPVVSRETGVQRMIEWVSS